VKSSKFRNDFGQGAIQRLNKRALSVEIHGANGTLIDQFLRDSANQAVQTNTAARWKPYTFPIRSDEP